MRPSRSHHQVPSTNPRGASHGPPSSGHSSSSGRLLVKKTTVPKGSKGGSGGGGGISSNSIGRCRSASSLRTTEEEEKIIAASKRKTRVIVILGITLPVIACVLGIVAWAVTTDILRITPRDSDNDSSSEQFENQDEKRVDALQPRIDPGVDVFSLGETTKRTVRTEPTTVKTTLLSQFTKTLSTKMQVPRKTTPLMIDVITTTTTKPTTKVLSTTTDILSKLLSRGTTKKTPEFVVFSPILDEPSPSVNKNKPIKKGKHVPVVIDDDTDLVAEESVVSEELSQEFDSRDSNFNKKRRSKFEERQFKTTPSQKRRLKFQESQDKNYVKSKTDYQIMDTTSPRPLHFDFESINLGVDDTTNQNNNAMQKSLNNAGQNSMYNPLNNVGQTSMQTTLSNVGQTSMHTPSNNAGQNSMHTPLNNVGQNSMNTPLNNVGRKSMQINRNSPHVGIGGQFRQNEPPNSFTNLQTSPSQGFQQHSSTQFQGSQQSFQGTVIDPSLNSQPSSYHMNKQNSQQQNYDTPSFHNFQSGGPQMNTNFQSQHSGPSSFNSASSSFQHGTHMKPLSGPQSSFQGSQQSFQSMMTSNGDPQYFAPPPQTFHSKTSYDGSGGLSQPPMGAYENIAQSSVSGLDNGNGGHHHHHHHHHDNMGHDPHDTLSDLSNGPVTNDADRLGTIGLGSGSSPRGITLQIGGGPVGLSGLLPLGALGIARGILGSLLPRPTLGLNGRVFLGVEVGKGGGLVIG